MKTVLFIAAGVVLLFILSIVVLLTTRNKNAPDESSHPKGHWMGVGIVIGLGIGMPAAFLFGIIFDNMAVSISLGPALGIGTGTAVGAFLEKKHAADTRELTEHERNNNRVVTIAGGIVFLLGIFVLLALALKFI